MANASLGWQVNDRVNLFLSSETRSKRFEGVSAISGQPLYYRDYTVLHLGAQYRFNDRVSLNARINNLLDEDFTTFQTLWTQDANTGEWAPTYLDDYNNKDKSRNLWLSLNVSF